YNRFNLQGDTGVSCLKILRSAWRGNHRNRAGGDKYAVKYGTRLRSRNLWNLRRRKIRGITKFSNNFDNGPLPAFGCHFWSGKKIDPFLLVESPDHNLKLRIGKNAGQPEDARGNAHPTST